MANARPTAVAAVVIMNRFSERFLGAVAVFCLAVAVCRAGAATQPALQYVEGEVLVTFKGSASLDSAQRALAAHSLQFAKHFSFLSRQRGRQFGLVRDPSRTTAALIAELSADPSVAAVEPNHLRWISSAAPDDEFFGWLWGLRNTGAPVNGFSGTPGADIGFLAAWDMARPSTNPVVVAVIDTGVDYTHPDLAGNMWTNALEIPGNGLDDDANGYVDDVYGYDFIDEVSSPSDSGYHGTHVAGTIAALGNNRVGVIGVNYHARIMALKASNDGTSLTTAAIIEALQYAAMMKSNGVNIAAINASFGGRSYSSVESEAIQSAGEAGIILCAAAGNDSFDHDIYPVYPASYRLPNMIVVAATTSSDELASFSDYGATTVDLGAPGVNILSTKPTSLPGNLAHTSVQQGPASLSANALTFSGTTTGLTATVYDCGLGYPEDFPTNVQSYIALIHRGTLYFSEKVSNAMAAGASAAIIYNNTNGNFSGTLQSPGSWIPAVSISQADGFALKALLPTTATVVNWEDPDQHYQFLDGTSMATPHVTGAVAFAAMNFPGETVTQRVQRILASVDVVPGLQGLVLTGGRLNVLRSVDADGNGLPDWWEQEYFGQLTGTDPAADPDHDGASNLAEWLAGTNPTDASSCLRVFAESADLTSGFTVRWPSVEGKTYRLERATNLLTGFDSVVRTNIAATPPLNSETDTAILPGDARYYRVRLEP
jgi:subtilisin family serine protease